MPPRGVRCVVLLAIPLVLQIGPSAGQAQSESTKPPGVIVLPRHVVQQGLDQAAIRRAVTLYASFDSQIAADIAGGAKTVKTRTDDPRAKGQFVVTDGFPQHAFRIARESGVAGGTLQATDVLPNRGRLFFPAAGNIGYRPKVGAAAPHSG